MIAAIVQARMGSTRLPGKVLREAASKPLLGHLLERLGACRSLDRIIVATSTDPRDAAIANFCASRGATVVRGSETDVLDRYYHAARAHGVDLIVRVTADCPLTDPAIVDGMVQYAVEHMGEYDLVTNRHPLTYPDGLDLDVIPFGALRDAWLHATTTPEREHVIPYFWNAGRRVHNLEHPDNLYDRYRWTLDYPEDYDVIAAIFDGLYVAPGTVFSMTEIIEYVTRHPELVERNAKYIVPQPPVTRTAVPARVVLATPAATAI